MATFHIKGGVPLFGKVSVPGAKNAALKIIAATILANGPCKLSRVPAISDVSKMLEVLQSMGSVIVRNGSHEIVIDTTHIDPLRMQKDLVAEFRASVVLMGPLLARFGRVAMPYPGGDRIGARPLDAHRSVFEQFGADVVHWGKEGLEVHLPKSSQNLRVVLPEFSVTATENALLLAAAREGASEILIAAAEPHVEDLARFLAKMGAEIRGAGTHTIEVQGRASLSPTAHTVMPDQLDAATFLVAAAVTKGKIEVVGAQFRDLALVLFKLREMGVEIEESSGTITASWKNPLRAVKFQALPHPGMPTDLQAPFAVLATQAEGESLIHDPLFEDRFKYATELSRMGADVRQLDVHRLKVRGPMSLSGTTITSFDIRAGVAMVLAGLVAQGETIIEDIEHIDRGYEDLDGRLRTLGAEIQRIS